MLVGHDARMRILYRFHGWLIFGGVMALYDENSFYILFKLVYATTHLSFCGFCSYLVCWLGMMWGCAYYTDFMVGWFLPELWPFKMKIHFTSCLSLCTQVLIDPLVDFVHIWYVGWAWCEDAHIIPILWLVDFCRSYGPLWWKFILHLVYACVHYYSFIFWRILFMFGMLTGHDGRMCILYRFYGWLIFAGVMALLWWKFILHLVYACVRNYSFILWLILFIFGMLVGHDGRMCILYLFYGWLIFAGVMALYDENSFYILFTLVYATTHLTFGRFCSYLICELGMIWGYAYYTNFMVGWFLLVMALSGENW